MSCRVQCNAASCFWNPRCPEAWCVTRQRPSSSHGGNVVMWVGTCVFFRLAFVVLSASDPKGFDLDHPKNY